MHRKEGAVTHVSQRETQVDARNRMAEAPAPSWILETSDGPLTSPASDTIARGAP